MCIRHIVPAAAFAIVFFAQSAGHAQQRIVIDGSSGTAPLVAALAKDHAAAGGVAVAVGKGLGGKARFAALADSKIDIAMFSHGLDLAKVKKMGQAAHLFAKAPVVFAIHQSTKVAGLTEAQICAVYDGRIRNWKELGGPDLAIAAFARPDNEVDTEVIRAGIKCLRGLKFADGVTIAKRSGDMTKALVAAPGAIGMTSSVAVEQNRGTLQALSVEGIAPSIANLEAGRYRLARDAWLVTHNPPSAEVKGFLDFVRSPKGASVIRMNGAVAIRP